MSVMDFVPEEDSASPLFGWCHHYDGDPTPTSWLIKNILPETGGALISGQWGTYKTTVALDIATSVMTKVPFANKRYTVKRAGGVAYLALEGFGSLASRLTAIARMRGAIAPLPFLYRSDCPALTVADALDKLTALVERAMKEIQDKFSLPTVLIVIDTIISAAGYAKAGDDNDAAIAQRLMSVLSGLSHRTGALAIGIDHFGKITDTGTRGSSAKEGHADTVLALLADRELNGTVTNTRLAVRKQRDGPSGLEIPFTPKVIEISTDPDGEPITRTVIDWDEQATIKPADANWSKSLQLLRRILMTLLTDAGSDTTPFADGPTVRTIDLGLVRNEFYKQYPAEGDEKQKRDARRQAFNRTVKDAQAKSLISTREVDGVQLVWLVKPGEHP